MKRVLNELRMGDRLQGKVQENLSGGEMIISFEGDLLRVQNQTRKPLALGAQVTVVVTAVRPLRFQLLPEQNDLRRRGRIDVSI